jgi:hypothetical protein
VVAVAQITPAIHPSLLFGVQNWHLRGTHISNGPPRTMSSPVPETRQSKIAVGNTAIPPHEMKNDEPITPKNQTTLSLFSVSTDNW